MIQDKRDQDKALNLVNTKEISPSDIDFLFSFIEKEREYQAITASSLDKIFHYLINNKSEFDKLKKKIWKSFYVCAFKNEVWYENILYSILNFYIKSDESIEDEFLKLFFGIFNDHKSKLDLSKIKQFFNPDDNYFFNMLKNNGSCITTFYKVIFFHEAIEKIFFSVENKEKCKQKHKKITLMGLDNLKHSMIDYYIVLITLKFRNEPVKLLKKDIEIERNCIRLFIKNYDNICSYFMNNLLLCFNVNENYQNRKNLFFVILIILRLCSLSFFSKLIKHITVNLHSLKIQNLDFSLLNDKNHLVFSIINSTQGFQKCIETIFLEMLSAQDNEEEDLNRFNQRFNCLFNIIELLETISLKKEIVNGKVLTIYYEYYNQLQRKILHSFIFPDALNNKSTFDITSIQQKDKIQSLASKYKASYYDLYLTMNLFFEFNKHKYLSLIYPNWIILFLKLNNPYLVYEVIKNLLFSEKDGNIIFYFFTIKDEINYHIPFFWSHILELLLQELKTSEENYHFLINIKYIFFYEISLKNQLQLDKDCEVFHFFIKNLCLLTSSCFNLTDNNNTDKDLLMEVDEKPADEFIVKSRSEIFNIFYILINNFKDDSKVSNDVLKFIEYTVDLYINNQEFNYGDYVKNILKVLLIIFNKNNKEIIKVFSPYNVIITHLIRFIIKKIYELKNDKYFILLMEIKSFLNDNIYLEKIIYQSCKSIFMNECDSGFSISPFLFKNSKFSLSFLNRNILYNLSICKVLITLSSSYYEQIYEFLYEFIVENTKRLKIYQSDLNELKKIFISIYKIFSFLNIIPVEIDLFNYYTQLDKDQFLLLNSIIIKYYTVFIAKGKNSEHELRMIHHQLKDLMFDCITYIPLN